MDLLVTINRIKNLETPQIFKKGGRYYNSDIEIIEANFNQKELTKQITNEFHTLPVNMLMIHGRIWELTHRHKIEKVYIFNISLEDIKNRIKLEDMKLDIIYASEEKFNKTIKELKPRVITFNSKQLERG